MTFLTHIKILSLCTFIPYPCDRHTAALITFDVLVHDAWKGLICLCMFGFQFSLLVLISVDLYFQELFEISNQFIAYPSIAVAFRTRVFAVVKTTAIADVARVDVLVFGMNLGLNFFFCMRIELLSWLWLWNFNWDSALDSWSSILILIGVGCAKSFKQFALRVIYLVDFELLLIDQFGRLSHSFSMKLESRVSVEWRLVEQWACIHHWWFKSASILDGEGSQLVIPLEHWFLEHLVSLEGLLLDELVVHLSDASQHSISTLIQGASLAVWWIDLRKRCVNGLLHKWPVDALPSKDFSGLIDVFRNNEPQLAVSQNLQSLLEISFTGYRYDIAIFVNIVELQIFSKLLVETNIESPRASFNQFFIALYAREPLGVVVVDYFHFQFQS